MTLKKNEFFGGTFIPKRRKASWRHQPPKKNPIIKNFRYLKWRSWTLFSAILLGVGFTRILGTWNVWWSHGFSLVLQGKNVTFLHVLGQIHQHNTQLWSLQMTFLVGVAVPFAHRFEQGELKPTTWATKKTLLLSIESWLVNRFNRDPYNGLL